MHDDLTLMNRWHGVTADKEKFMSEPFIEKHAISTELSNVNREKHKLKSHRECRCDRETFKISSTTNYN